MELDNSSRREHSSIQSRVVDSSRWLRLNAPDFSADRTLGRWQALLLVGAALAAPLGLAIAPRATAVVLVGICTLIYLATLGFRIALFHRSQTTDAAISLDEPSLRMIPDHRLPSYTVLVPAYREPEVVGKMLHSIRQIDYPRDRLEVKLLLEADDPETLAAAQAAAPPPEVEIMVVPTVTPLTKPKALNFGLLASSGELVTIFDAEDIPDPLQLRRAAAALENAPATLACVQAKLAYFNVSQNIITEWFTLEYDMWFSQFLPGLVAAGHPVPLGGTSTHFRREVLERLGGWDPHNVTEDADLGLRLHRLGYRVGMLDSTTLEEANSDFVNWAKQRSRWYKGYLQTWFVHLRQPGALWRALGPRGFGAFNLFMGGTPLLALINPVFWFITLTWFIAQPAAVRSIFPGPLFHLGLLSWLVGNFLFVYLFLVTAASRKTVNLLRAALLAPVYALMMSIAGWKAVFQLFATPSFWEKTRHGLAQEGSDDVAVSAPEKARK